MSRSYSVSQHSKSIASNDRNSSSFRPTHARSVAANNEVDGELALESYINSLQLQTFGNLSPEEQDECLDKMDSLELYDAVQKINIESAMIKLEIHFLTDFLDKNDPKLLIGLQQRRDAAQTQQANIIKPIKETTVGSTGGGSSLGGRVKGSFTKSLMSMNTIGSIKKPTVDYKLNFRAKADMAEKTANEVEKRVHVIEKKGKWSY